MKMLKAWLLSCALLVSSAALSATVTGQFAINFAPLSDANPYSLPADFDQIDGTGRIVSGLWRTADPATNTHAILDSGTYTFGNQVCAKIELGDAAGYDGLWVLVWDASGNGYGARLSFDTTLSSIRFDAGTGVGGTLLTDTVTPVDGDQLMLCYTKSTGAVVVSYNGTPMPSLGFTDSTHAALTLMAGFAQRPQDTGDGGIRSFAADGLAGGSSPLRKIIQQLEH